MRVELDDAEKDKSIEAAANATDARRTISPRIATALAVMTLLVTAAVVWTLKPVTALRRESIVHLAATLPSGEELRAAAGPPAVLSADGSMLAYASVRQGGTALLYLRPMDNSEAKVVLGSEGAFNPFFSPNGQWVGFFSQGKLKKVSVTGGAVETVCDAANGRGGSWAEDDTIYFAPANTSGIWKISASGGTPQPVTTVDRSPGEVSHRWPGVAWRQGRGL
jgi:serine/threonine-protein kinase